MKKRMLCFTIVFFMVILAMPGLGTEATDRMKQPAQQVKPLATQLEVYTVMCPATINAQVGTQAINPGSGWEAFPNMSLKKQLALDGCEITQQNYLQCLYKYPAFCQCKDANEHCWTAIRQQIKPGYSCEKLPSNNGFTCRLKKPKTEEQYKHDKQPKN